MPDPSTRHVAFVRAVMVGREGLSREVLVGIFEAAGAADVRSHLATGNVSFHLAAADVDRLVDEVEQSITAVVGRQTEVFVRSQRELERLVADDPFAIQPYETPRDLAVLFFRRQVPRSFETPVVYGGTATAFAKRRRELLIVTRNRPDGGHPGSPVGIIERQANQRVTARAWSTILRVTRA